MNAQSNHPIRTSQTRTTDPQFLGPEAGQQAGGEEQCVNELDANGTELHRYFSVARGALISVRSNGVTLCRQVVGRFIKPPCLLASLGAEELRIGGASLGSTDGVVGLCVHAGGLVWWLKKSARRFRLDA